MQHETTADGQENDRRSVDSGQQEKQSEPAPGNDWRWGPDLLGNQRDLKSTPRRAARATRKRGELQINGVKQAANRGLATEFPANGRPRTRTESRGPKSKAAGQKSLQTAARKTSRKTAGAQSQNLSSTKKISQDNPAADKKQKPSGTKKIKMEAAVRTIPGTDTCGGTKTEQHENEHGTEANFAQD
jgi:hypothetical protein